MCNPPWDFSGREGFAVSEGPNSPGTAGGGPHGNLWPEWSQRLQPALLSPQESTLLAGLSCVPSATSKDCHCPCGPQRQDKQVHPGPCRTNCWGLPCHLGCEGSVGGVCHRPSNGQLRPSRHTPAILGPRSKCKCLHFPESSGVSSCQLPRLACLAFHGSHGTAKGRGLAHAPSSGLHMDCPLCLSAPIPCSSTPSAQPPPPRSSTLSPQAEWLPILCYNPHWQSPSRRTPSLGTKGAVPSLPADRGPADSGLGNHLRSA